MEPTNSSLQPQGAGGGATRNPQSNAPSNLQPQTSPLQNATNSGSDIMRRLEQQPSGSLKVDSGSGAAAPRLTTQQTQASTTKQAAAASKNNTLLYAGLAVIVVLFVVALCYSMFHERPYKPSY